MKVVNLKFVLNNRPAANGLHLLMLYIFKSGSKSPAYIGTGIYIKEAHFNPKGTREGQNWIRRSDLAAKHNIELANIYDHAAKVVKLLKDTNRIDTANNQQIKQYIESGDPADLLVFMRNYKAELEENNQHSRSSQYRTVVNALEKFYGEKLPIGSITYPFLIDFRDKLIGTKIKSSTIKSYFSIFQAAYNTYHTKNMIIPQGNPFTIFDPELPTAADSPKGMVYPSQVQKLLSDDVSKLSEVERHSINIYLLLYFLQGIRVGDLLKLRRTNVVLTHDLVSNQKLYRIEYSMGKNQKARLLPVPVVANYLIEYYWDMIVDERQNQPDGYFLPFMYFMPGGKTTKAYKTNLTSSRAAYYRLANLNDVINERFQTACQKLGITDTLTMHTSRHSLAAHLYEKTKDLKAVQDSLAHSSVVTTERYLRSYVQSNKASQVYEDYETNKAN